MEVHFIPELQPKVDAIGAEANSATDGYVQSLGENYIEHDAGFEFGGKRRKGCGAEQFIAFDR